MMCFKKKTIFAVLLLGFLILLMSIAANHFAMGVNQTQSLHCTLFLLEKYEPLQKGDHVSFKKPTLGLLPDDTVFVKEIKGAAGDTVTHEERKVFINNVYVGDIKLKSKAGENLSPGFTGIIPEGFFFVGTGHSYSFDSRYAQMGLIHESEIMARAYPLW